MMDGELDVVAVEESEVLEDDGGRCEDEDEDNNVLAVRCRLAAENTDVGDRRRAFRMVVMCSASSGLMRG